MTRPQHTHITQQHRDEVMRLLDEREMSVRDLARRAEVHRPHLLDFLDGYADNPGTKWLEKLYRALRG